MGCQAKECRALRYEDGYTVSSNFPLLNSMYKSPGIQHMGGWGGEGNKRALWDVCQVPMHIRQSTYMSTCGITAAGVIYVHQSPGGALAVLEHIHASVAARDTPAPAWCLSSDPGKHP